MGTPKQVVEVPEGVLVSPMEEDPNAIYEGNSGELLAVRAIMNRKDGFISTAFISSKMKQIEKRKRVWLRQK